MRPLLEHLADKRLHLGRVHRTVVTDQLLELHLGREPQVRRRGESRGRCVLLDIGTSVLDRASESRSCSSARTRYRRFLASARSTRGIGGGVIDVLWLARRLVPVRRVGRRLRLVAGIVRVSSVLIVMSLPLGGPSDDPGPGGHAVRCARALVVDLLPMNLDHLAARRAAARQWLDPPAGPSMGCSRATAIASRPGQAPPLS